MNLVNINFTVLAHAYVLYARALQSRIRSGTFSAPVRPALKSGTAMRTTVKSGTAFAVPAGPSTPPLYGIRLRNFTTTSRGGSRIDCRGGLSIPRANAREILCATPTFDVISVHDMLYEEKVNK